MDGVEIRFPDGSVWRVPSDPANMSQFAAQVQWLADGAFAITQLHAVEERLTLRAHPDVRLPQERILDHEHVS